MSLFVDGKKRHFKALRFFLPLLLLCGVLYTGFWFWFAARIEQGARDFVFDLQKRPDIGVAVRGLGVSGFPGIPIVTFSGTIHDSATAVHIPVLRMQGVFLPGSVLDAEIPQGYAIHSTRSFAFQNLLLAQIVRIRVVIPAHLPADFSENSMRTWRDESNAVALEDITILRDDGLAIMGAGGIGLDEDLQPDVRLRLAILRPDLLVRDLVDGKILNGTQENIARGVVAALTENDGSLHTDFAIRNGGMYLGPIRVGAAPRLVWVPESSPGTRNPPVRPQ
ncbi:MAG: DUF2125 domain-containing protein [Rhodospirillales bacterium]|nr:DUF2125 domain-containing protein [Rhodospirillales bacterium]